MEKLKPFSKYKPRPGPIVLVIMDGIGINPNTTGNAVKAAYTPTLDWLMKNHPNTLLRAHGKAVGLPSDSDMGNSEVGHNALGAGRVFHQGARLVNEAIESGRLWEGQTWQKLIQNCLSHDSTLHFIGLFSDGNVHSHINHLKAMLQRAKQEGIGRCRIHILLDGRDVGERSALEYVTPFETFLKELNDSEVDYAIVAPLLQALDKVAFIESVAVSEAFRQGQRHRRVARPLSRLKTEDSAAHHFVELSEAAFATRVRDTDGFPGGETEHRTACAVADPFE